MVKLLKQIIQIAVQINKDVKIYMAEVKNVVDKMRTSSLILSHAQEDRTQRMGAMKCLN